MNRFIKRLAKVRKGILALALCQLAIPLGAQTFTRGNLDFTVISATDHTVGVKSNSTGVTIVTIPDTIMDGSTVYTVTELAEEAFSNCKSLTEVTLPATIKFSRNKAFYYCSNLATVNVADPVAFCQITFAAGNANPVFYAEALYCKGKLVTEIALPEGDTIVQPWGFYYNKGLKQITLPSTIKTLSSYCLANLPTGIKLSIPTSVENIEKYALSATPIEELILPNLKHIDEYGLASVKEIKRLVLPETFETIPKSAFSSLTTLEEIVFPKKINRVENLAFAELGLRKMELPESLKFIGDQAFWRMDSLTSLTINANVDTIGHRAFYNTKAGIITKVTMKATVLPYCVPNSKGVLETFTTATYANATLMVPKGSLETYKNAAPWSNFEKIEEYDPTTEGKVVTDGNVKYTITSASDFTAVASAANTNITSADIKGSITYSGTTFTVEAIAADGFAGCSKLTEITIPDYITSIGAGAFAGCTALTKASSSSLKTWMGIDFADAKANPLSAAGHLVINGSEITALTLPDSLSTVKPYTFYGATGITSLKATTLNAGTYSFAGCKGLTSIQLPDSTGIFADYAFADNGMTELPVLPLQATYGFGVFANSKNMVKAVIPAGMERIPAGLLTGCDKLDSLILTDDVLYIGDEALSATGLKSFTTPTFLKTIESKAFANSQALQEVTINNEVELVGADAFAGCEKITTVTLYGRTPPVGKASNNGSYDTFTKGVYSTARLLIPKGSGDAYKAAEPWKNFTKIIETEFSGVEERTFTQGDFTYKVLSSEDKTVLVGAASTEITSAVLPATVTNVNNGFFYNVVGVAEEGFKGCRKLESITFQPSIVQSSVNAFPDCYALTTVEIGKLEDWVKINFADSTANPTYSSHSLTLNGQKITTLTIPSTITEVAPYTFFSVTNLRKVELPDNFKEVGNSAFEKCTSLKSVNFPESLRRIGKRAFRGLAALSLELPDSVMVDEYAFADGGFISAKLPASMKHLLFATFLRCESLKTIEWPENLRTINMSSVNQVGMTEIRIPNSVDTIYEWACANNDYLKKVVIGSGVKAMGKACFFRMQSTTLDSVISWATVPPALSVSEEYGSGTFFNSTVYTTTPLYVPTASIEAYQGAPEWSKFTRILSLEDYLGIGATESDSSSIYVENGEIVVSGATSVSVYTTGGTCIYRGTSGKVTPTAKGVYIVNADGKTAKVMI